MSLYDTSPSAQDNRAAASMFGRLTRPVAILTAYGAAGKLASMACTPILTRLYDQQAFGVFSVFAAITSVIAVVATGRYELAVARPRRDATATALLAISSLLAVATVLIVSLVLAVAHENVAGWLGEPKVAPYLWLLPPTLLGAAAIHAVTFWLLRAGRINRLALVRLAMPALIVGLQIGLNGVSARGGAGLILGFAAGQAIAAVWMLASADLHSAAGALSLRLMRAAAHRYRALPGYMVQSALFNAIAVHAMPLAVAALLDSAAAGLFLLAQTMVVAPLALFTRPLWQVLHTRMSTADPAAQRQIFTDAHRAAAFLFAPAMAFVAFYAHYSGLVFGPEWQPLGVILPAFALYSLSNAVSQSSSYFAACGLIRAEARVNILLMVVKFGALVLAAWLLEPLAALSALALATACFYLGVNLFWAARFGLIIGTLRRLGASTVVGVAMVWPTRLLTDQSPPAGLGLLALLLCIYYYLAVRWYRRRRVRLV